MAPDALFAVRNQLYLGAYQQVILQCSGSGAASAASSAVERQTLLHRAYLAQGKPALVLSEISPSTDAIELQLLRISAQLRQLSKTDNGGDLLVSVTQTLESTPANLLNPIAVLIAASALYDAGEYEQALRYLAHHPRHLECAFLTTQIYLAINRIDLAQRSIADIKSWAEDAPIAQLIEAIVNLSVGGDTKYTEALYAFEELAQGSGISGGPTTQLLNWQAVANMQLGRLSEAEGLLTTAINKSDSDANTLANLTVLGLLQHKPAATLAQYKTQLTASTPDHVLLQNIARQNELFDAAAAQYAK
ncbi:hypothetical protein GQ42DRAFT_24948 [Ramicandelaber brevisporus]|nr:hypothetical protein GQ42DRAFT_24948 [Ramicandelaber brevisporus]